MLPSGTLSGALLVNRAGRSGLAIKSWPKATASASPSAMTWFACASVYFSFAMKTPPNCLLELRSQSVGTEILARKQEAEFAPA